MGQFLKEDWIIMQVTIWMNILIQKSYSLGKIVIIFLYNTLLFLPLKNFENNCTCDFNNKFYYQIA